MNKLLKICLCLIVVAVCALCAGMTKDNKVVSKTEITSQLHVVINAQDDKTEVDISVDGKPYDNMVLSKGINFIPYKTKATKPTIEILAYGDSLKPVITKKRYNNYYTYLDISPPVDGDGYKFK